MIIVSRIVLIFSVLTLPLFFVAGAYADEHGTEVNAAQPVENVLVEEVIEEEEELPLIDPFLGGSMNATQAGDTIETNEFGIDNSIFKNMRLIGTIRGHYKRLAIISAPDGRAFKYTEKEYITDDIQLTRIYNDFIIIKDIDKNEYEVHMNNQIKPREKKKK
jgi:hypothetical protein